MKKYGVEYYDGFDGEWYGSNEFLFEDLEEATKFARNMTAKLPENDRRMGSHYDVIDTATGFIASHL